MLGLTIFMGRCAPCLRTISTTLHQIDPIYSLVQLNYAVITWSEPITDFRDHITDNDSASLCLYLNGVCPSAGVEALPLIGVTHSQFTYNFLIQFYVRAVFSQDVS
jgi:hypothetical protein